MPSIRSEITTYCRDVATGRETSGKLVMAAVERHNRDLRDAHKRGFTFDWATAERAINFIQLLKHTTGEFEGQHFILRPWQKFIVGSVFGWKRQDGYRRFREVFDSMGRGNGKTPLVSAILLYLLCADVPAEPRAQVICAAADRSQAFTLWREAFEQVQSCPTLASKIRYVSEERATTYTKMTYTPNNSVLWPFGKDSRNKDGFNLNAAVKDEIHEFDESHERLVAKITTAMGKRRQPLDFEITTAGTDESAYWKRRRNYSVQVVTGVIDDDAHFSYIAEIDDEDIERTVIGEDGKETVIKDAWMDDPTCWKKANPNIGISVKVDYLERLVRLQDVGLRRSKPASLLQ